MNLSHRQAESSVGRPKPTPKANSGPQKVRPGSRLAAHGPLSVSGDAKGISPIIAERLSPNRMPSLRRRCCSWTLVRDGGHWVRLSRHGVRHRVGDEATPVALRQGSLRVGQRADPHPPGGIRDTETGLRYWRDAAPRTPSGALDSPSSFPPPLVLPTSMDRTSLALP